MNKNDRKNKLKELLKKAEHEALPAKIAQDQDINDAVDAADYSDKVFNKLLDSIKIEGLED